MNMLSKLTADSDIKEETDSIGGSRTLESGLYPMTIGMAYLKTSAGGALGLELSLKTAANEEVKQTLWMTSGTAKGGKNYYEKEGVKSFLPGFNHAQGLCILTTGKEVSAMDVESKVVKIYNFEAKKEVPTKVDVLVDLIGKDILIGLIKQTVDKNVKTDSGAYIPTGETRDENEIDKMFRASDRFTTAEIRTKAEVASFADSWETKHTGVTRMRAKGASANAGVAGAPRPSGAVASAVSSKPKSSLFA